MGIIAFSFFETVISPVVNISIKVLNVLVHTLDDCTRLINLVFYTCDATMLCIICFCLLFYVNINTRCYIRKGTYTYGALPYDKQIHDQKPYVYIVIMQALFTIQC